MGVRVAYISDFSQPWYTPVHIARDAEAIGCEVERIDERQVAEHGFSPTPGTDAVWYTKHHGLPARATDLWAELEGQGIRTASQHLDLYVPLRRGTELVTDPFWRTGVVFSPDGDRYSAEVFAVQRIRHHWLPPACVSDECIRIRDIGHTDRYPQIVFVGSSRSYHREYPWRMRMLDVLREHFGPRFGVIGPQEGMLVRGLDLNALYQTGNRVVVGDSLMLAGHSRYTSDRLFETLGRGGVLVWPRMDWLTELGFQEYEHLRYFTPQDPDSLIGTIEDVLADPWSARQMAERGQRFVREKHSYKNRVATMLDVLGLNESE